MKALFNDLEKLNLIGMNTSKHASLTQSCYYPFMHDVNKFALRALKVGHTDMQEDQKSPFDWHHDCQFELLLDGTEFFPRILQYIEDAQRCIDIEVYLVASGTATAQVVAALSAAAQRGVAVRCLFDASGSADFIAAERETLREAGVDLRFYNPITWFGGVRNLHRDHRKVLIFDQHIACTGGLGFTDAFCAANDKQQTLWHEQMLVVKGEIVADWRRLFEQSWQQADKPQRKVLNSRTKKHATVPLPEAKAGLGRVAFSASRNNRDLLLSLVTRIRHAQTRIWLSTPYFVPPRVLRIALTQAARRGVDVRLQVSGHFTDLPAVRYAGQIYYTKLLRAGVRIFEYQPRFSHLKSALIDQWVTLGSYNFDHWTLHWNLEANQNVLDPALADTVQHSFEQDFSQSTELTRQTWLQLPLHYRLKIWFWGRVKKLVDLFVSFY
jgi:phosphatidylserine/phosphatidylglycerophosphate/cardiolipin synthase-like enzyme